MKLTNYLKIIEQHPNAVAWQKENLPNGMELFEKAKTMAEIAGLTCDWEVVYSPKEESEEHKVSAIFNFSNPKKEGQIKSAGVTGKCIEDLSDAELLDIAMALFIPIIRRCP